jgi:hypothetical protein
MDILSQLSADAPVCEPPFTFGTVTIVVIISCVLGLLWAAFNFMSVRKIDVERGEDGESDSLIGAIT